MWLSGYQIGGEDDNLHAVSSVSNSICSQCFEVQVCETNVIEQPSYIYRRIKLRFASTEFQFYATWRELIELHVFPIS